MKPILTVFIVLALATSSNAQLEISALGAAVTVDFTGFAGTGFDPVPADGQLDSDTWSVTGLSDGDVEFGGSGTTGDFARGTTTGGVTTGGVYAADILGNQALMVQPGADDFTPGSFVLKLQNTTDVVIGEMAVSYTLYILNDQFRANSFNFSFSYDNETWVDVPALDYTSGESPEVFPAVVSLDASIIGLIWETGDFLYARWSGDDVSGSGSRDEFALDDIAFTAFEGEELPVVNMAASALSVDESTSSVTVSITITDDADCTVSVPLGAATATNDVDFSYDPTSFVTFTEGGSLTQTLLVPIIEDAEIEGPESFELLLSTVIGTCIIGTSDVTVVTIVDNDEPVATETDIIDISGEDASGVSLNLDEYVTVTGVVYGFNLRSGGLEFTLIDETAGIRVFNFSETLGYTPEEGDEITITGYVTQFNGLTQIEPESLTVLSSGNALKVPTPVLTLDESTESDLVVLDSCVMVTPAEWLGDGSSFNVNLTCEGGAAIVLRIDDLTDLSTSAAPDGAFTLTGIGGQFDASSPYLEGYQIIPRYAADIVVIPVDTIDFVVNKDITGIRVFPNPASDFILIESEYFTWQQAWLMDVAGRLVWSARHDVALGQFTIPVRELESGLYQLMLIGENEAYTTSLVIE